ncbi:hypothetical protein Tco_0330079, partial [Tanacetum coccineum]
MHSIGKTVNELHDMLKQHKETLPKKVVAPALHAIRAGKVQKNKNKKPSKAAKGVQRKGKGKKAYANAEPSYAPKPKNLPVSLNLLSQTRKLGHSTMELRSLIS